MPNKEPKTVEATYGPYAGKRLTMPPADAEQAISDGWARDPFAPPSEEPAQLLSEEERAKAVEAAEKAGRKLRGEEEAEAKPVQNETRDMSAGEPGEYATRAARQPAPPRRR